MIRVEGLEVREIALPLREPFQISSGTATTRRILLVRLFGVDGETAWAECVASSKPNYSPETVDTAWIAIREWVAPRLLHVPWKAAADVHEALQRDFRGHRMAKAAVEMAMWCLEAERNQRSLAETIGGTREVIPVGISLGIQPNPAALVAKAQSALDEGYRKIKLKIKPAADVTFVAAVREALGPGAPLMADANNAYALSDLDVLRSLDTLGLIMIEQPLAWDDIARHATLQSHLTTPICLDESITSVERVEDMIALSSGQIVNIKPGRVGGFAESKAIHDLCESHKIPVWCGGMLESGIGRAYNVALSSLPNFVIPGDNSPSRRYWERDVVEPEWTMTPEGTMRVPRDRPGLGVTVNVDRIDDLTVRVERLAA